jgi:alpha-1,6-mannosyltransferase
VVAGHTPAQHALLRQRRAPLIWLALLGLSMLAFVAAAPSIGNTFGYATLIPALVASGAITVAAGLVAPHAPTRSAIFLILGLAVVMRFVVMLGEPFLSTDIYRYVWDGRVQAAGINPYRYVPADPTLLALRDTTIYPNINRADYAVTAYPPVAQMVFLAVTRLSETVTMMRLAMVGCEIVILGVMLDLLRKLRLASASVVTWAWHPLAIWEIAHSGHVEALMVALLMLGVWLLARHRALMGAVVVSLAVLCKPYALVVLPCFWRSWDWRLPVIVAAAIALCYAPYLGVGPGVFGFVASGYLAEETFSAGRGFWLVGLAEVVIGAVPGLISLYLLAALCALAWLAAQVTSSDDADLSDMVKEIAVLLMAGLFFLSPNYPWYFLAIVPFIPLCGVSLTVIAWAMTLAAPLLYRPALLPHNDLVWKTLATLPFIASIALALLRTRTGSTKKGTVQWTN